MNTVDTSRVNMDPGVTPAQGRVLFHMERLFRSTGGPGVLAHRDFIASCKAEGLPERIDTWTREQCVLGLRLIESVCSPYKTMRLFRNTRTGWETL